MLYEKLDRIVEPEQRRSTRRHRPPRETINATGEIRQMGLDFRKVSFVDLSIAGFRIYYPCSLSLNETLRVRFPGMATLNARICWSKGSEYGCRFENPLYPSVWEHLVRQYR